MKRFAWTLAAALLFPAAARAGACDAHARKAASAKGDELVDAFKAFVACSPKEASEGFEPFMKASGDVGTLVGLSSVAIKAQLYAPVWQMLEKVPDFSARTEVAAGIGDRCAQQADVVPFLERTYAELKGIQFGHWSPAFGACEVGPFKEWLAAEASKPPTSAFDEKYPSLLDAYIGHIGVEALPVLGKAAVAAAGNGGPFPAVIERMEKAIKPTEMGAKVKAEDVTRLKAALAEVANAVGPKEASVVAEHLFQMGDAAAAAQLLPRVYPDRVQAGGKLLYGAAAVEVCDKEASVHWVAVTEPARRWSITEDITPLVRAAKPKLKCAATEPWAVMITPEPVASAKDVAAWADTVASQWSAKGIVAKLKEEKAITLP